MEVVNAFVVLLAAFTPALVWLFFFLREDAAHPEPRRLIAKVFLFGALATIPTFLTQSAADELFVGSWPFLVVWFAFAEEVFKFLAAWVAVRRDPAFDEPVDAMIYMVAASLGFATVENIFVTGSSYPLSASLGTFFLEGGTLTTLTYRFVGATLLHVLASAFVGYMWAVGWAKGRPLHTLALGLFIATAVHALFNFLIYRFQGENLLIPVLFLVVAGFFVLADFERVKRLT